MHINAIGQTGEQQHSNRAIANGPCKFVFAPFGIDSPIRKHWPRFVDMWRDKTQSLFLSLNCILQHGQIKKRFQWFVIMKSIFYMFTAIKRCARLHRIFCCLHDKIRPERKVLRNAICWLSNYKRLLFWFYFCAFFVVVDVCCCCCHLSLIYSKKVENGFYAWKQERKR